MTSTMTTTTTTTTTHASGTKRKTAGGPAQPGLVTTQPAHPVYQPGLVTTQPDIICQSGDVKRASLAELLQDALSAGCRLEMPLFQRRFCWEPKTHGAQLLRDVIKACGGCARQQQTGFSHSLGRVMIYDTRTSDVAAQSLLVLDGQQRITTLCLLLSAVIALGKSDVVRAIDEGLSVSITSMLAGVTPTYFDRSHTLYCTGWASLSFE